MPTTSWRCAIVGATTTVNTRATRKKVPTPTTDLSPSQWLRDPDCAPGLFFSDPAPQRGRQKVAPDPSTKLVFVVHLHVDPFPHRVVTADSGSDQIRFDRRAGGFEIRSA